MAASTHVPFEHLRDVQLPSTATHITTRTLFGPRSILSGSSWALLCPRSILAGSWTLLHCSRAAPPLPGTNLRFSSSSGDGGGGGGGEKDTGLERGRVRGGINGGWGWNFKDKLGFPATLAAGVDLLFLHGLASALYLHA